MDWLQLGHDECPNCRQPMWDSETYSSVDQYIKGQHPIPSAPLEVDVNVGDALSVDLPLV